MNNYSKGFLSITMDAQIALQYEYQVVDEHTKKFNQITWHNYVIPEDVYHESGYINDFNRIRLERIIRNNKKMKK